MKLYKNSYLTKGSQCFVLLGIYLYHFRKNVSSTIFIYYLENKQINIKK